METGRAVVLHPAAFRTPWHVALVLAAYEVGSHLVLTLAVVTGGAIAVLLLLVLAVVSAPLGAAFVTWIVVRAVSQGGRAARRHARARAPHLTALRGGTP